MSTIFSATLFTIKVICNDILQKFFSINTRDYIPCTVMVGDVSRIFRQYVSDNLPHRIIALLPQGIINLQHSFFTHFLIQLTHLVQSIPYSTRKRQSLCAAAP